MSWRADVSKMDRNHYDTELDELAATYQHGLMLDVAPLRSAIAGACESSIIGVGSGGSYTVASLADYGIVQLTIAKTW